MPSSNEPRQRPAAGSWWVGPGLLAAGAVGAALAYIFDPDRGRSRRALLRDQTAGEIRRAARHAGRSGRWVTSVAVGKAEMVRHRAFDDREALNDADLAAKVESILFRDPTVPKGHMNVNAEDGTVVLRGIASSDAEIERIVDRVRRISDVREVRNLLHLPGTPPPNEPFLQPALDRNGHLAEAR